LEYEGDKSGNNVPDPEEIGIKHLRGDGDFRSPETIELLKQADVVVTNPPFSLFREYVDQLVEHDKKFIIIGHQNAITYKNIFDLLKDNRLWLGYGFKGNATHFITHYEDHATAGDHKEGMVRVSGVTWFTNLDIAKRHEDLILYKKYTPEEYPAYANYDAIEVSKTKDIPEDYDGVMGVPITFLDKYNPDQFAILGLSGTDYPTTKNYGKKERVVDGVRKKSNTGTLGCVIRTPSFGAGTHFDVGYPVKGIYRRLFIRRKEQNS